MINGRYYNPIDIYKMITDLSTFTKPSEYAQSDVCCQLAMMFRRRPFCKQIGSYRRKRTVWKPLYFVSGVNQIGIKIHTEPGDEVICEKLSHVYIYEGGACL
jgi:hypothetical protein